MGNKESTTMPPAPGDDRFGAGPNMRKVKNFNIH
jgi:hypothetical protein